MIYLFTHVFGLTVSSSSSSSSPFLFILSSNSFFSSPFFLPAMTASSLGDVDELCRVPQPPMPLHYVYCLLV